VLSEAGRGVGRSPTAFGVRQPPLAVRAGGVGCLVRGAQRTSTRRRTRARSIDEICPLTCVGTAGSCLRTEETLSRVIGNRCVGSSERHRVGVRL
jgi:hypothetical protein